MPRRSLSDSMTPIVPGYKPPPPAHLGPDAAEIWKALVDRLPPGRSNDVAFMLLGPLLVTHMSVERVLARQIDELMRADDPKQRSLLQSLRAEHVAQTRAVSNLATRLRLTAQSRYAPDSKAARTPASSPRPTPWTDWGDTRKPS
jgi:hypothetical protein